MCDTCDSKKDNIPGYTRAQHARKEHSLHSAPPPRYRLTTKHFRTQQKTHYTSILISTTIISNTNINKNCTFPRFFHSLGQYLGIYHRGVTQIPPPFHSFIHGTSHTNIFNPCKLTLVPTDRPKA